jgi:hypothetical protein
MVYNYFADNFGHTEKIPDKALVDKKRRPNSKGVEEISEKTKTFKRRTS